MEIVPVIFEVERTTSLIPILAVTGKAKNLLQIEPIIIGEALRIMENLEKKFKGKPIPLIGHENNINIPKWMMAVRFYMIFENEEDLSRAINSIQKGLE